MASSITTTVSRPMSADQTRGRIVKYSIAWTSHTDGSVNNAISSDSNGNAISFNGTLLAVETVPAGGGVQPSNLYDLTLTNANGLDMLVGAGANLTNSAGAIFVVSGYAVDGTTALYMPLPLVGAHTLVIANAGSGKQGTLVLYVQE